MIKFFLLCTTLITWNITMSQGCVAIRNAAGINSHLLFDYDQQGKLFMNVANRYFEAAETYRGKEFITDTLVRNKLYSINFSVTSVLKNGLSLSLTLPIAINSRTNSSDHGGAKTPKYTTRAFGIGDIRMGIYKWLLNTQKNTNKNIQIGLGLKFPTGDYEYKDYFHRNDSTQILAPVDQAIQLGDGGLGLTLELNSFYSLNNKIRLFANGFYLINPREQNGVSNLKGRNPTTAEIGNYTTVMSVPDQFTVRGGVSIEFQKLAISTAVKFDKVPVNDLLGGNKGFRRAASITSIEPGISYKVKNYLAYLNVAFPVKKNIVLNQQNNMTPAGFANYIFSFGASILLGR